MYLKLNSSKIKYRIVRDVFTLLSDEINDNFGYRIGVFADDGDVPFSIFVEEDSDEVYQLRQKLTKEVQFKKKKLLGVINTLKANESEGKFKIEIEDDMYDNMINLLNGLVSLYDLVVSMSKEVFAEAEREEARVQAVFTSIADELDHVSIEVINPYTELGASKVTAKDALESFASVISDIQTVIEKMTK